MLSSSGRRGSLLISVVLVPILICGMLAGCGGAKSRFDSHMQRGERYFTAGEFSKASLEYRNALQISPKDPNARLMVARTAEKLGRYADARGIYESVVESNPENLEARLRLGRIFLFGGAPERTLKVIEPAFAAHPAEARLFALRAAARTGTKDPDGALADVSHALELDPANEDAIGLRARLYQQAGDLPAATALVANGVQRVPASTQLREVLADLYLAQKEFNKAIEQLQALVSLDPKESRRLNQLALVYLAAHRIDDAQHALENAVRAFPASDEVKLTLVEFLAAQRSKADARKALEGYIAHDPKDEDLRLGLGALLLSSGAEREAVGAYQEVIRRAGTKPNGLIARDRLATLAVQQKRFPDAEKLIAEVLARNPRDNDALALRGEMALARSDPAAAIVDLRAVLREQPQATGLQRSLAKAYIDNGQPELAEQALRAAMDVDPANLAVRADLAQLLLRTQRVDAGVGLLEENVRSAPTDLSAREMLVRGYLARGDLAAARAAAEDLKTVRPDSAAGSYMAGLVAQADKRFDDAERNYREALALQPGGLDIISSLARLEVQRGQAAKAISFVKGESEQLPANAFLANLLGELYLTQQDVPAATAALDRATKLAPDWWVPLRSLAAARYEAKDEKGAIAAYQAAIRLAPNEPKLVSELAEIYQAGGRVDDAIAAYDAWNRKYPHVQLVANNLAMLLVTYRQDRVSLDRARELTAEFDAATEGALLDTDGWVRFKRAEYQEALPVLQRAAERTPDSREIRYHLGMTELRMGQTERARADLQTALAGTPRFAGYEDARTALASLKGRTS